MWLEGEFFWVSSVNGEEKFKLSFYFKSLIKELFCEAT